MTIYTLCTYIAIIAVLLTFIIDKYFHSVKSYLMSFLQNFCGGLFIFSGFVKAVDPLGTAYKMEEYFKEFELTAKGSIFSFSADLFPLLAEYAIGFSVFMIVLEIVVGIMLILGHKPKLTSWLFFVTIFFFTILTGFTYLTGYVPKETNFFEFSKWADYTATNMRVTNCGCFGDFIKLEPKTSFFKDIFLMFPAVFFLFNYKKAHTLFASGLRNAITLLSTFGLILFCIANYKWNEPMIDFRPFKSGTDVKAQKAAEAKAEADVKILSWKLQKLSDKSLKIVSDEEYMTNFKAYPKTEWKVLDQIKTEPSIPRTKISEFAIFDLDGNEFTETILTEPRSRIMINCPKLYFTSSTETKSIQDTIWKTDTLVVKKDSTPEYRQTVSEIKEKTVKLNVYKWDEEYKQLFLSKIIPFLDSVYQDSVKSYIVCGGASEEALKNLFEQISVKAQVLLADDILLKTIMRSNPGVVLWRNGKIVHKWHFNHLPDLTEMRRDFLDWNARPIH
ncbi:MAG: DoxX family membrane protein [Saprospiraceae bacterium]|nr:DoxX family membrane protein [Saprospiraceae bacterium]